MTTKGKLLTQMTTKDTGSAPKGNPTKEKPRDDSQQGKIISKWNRSKQKMTHAHDEATSLFQDRSHPSKEKLENSKAARH